MPRAPTTIDAFAAIAEPRRRIILGELARSRTERDVSWLVDRLSWPQPQVSKHLGVLREVGLVNVVRRGRRRVYSVNGKELKPVFDWVKVFEEFWDHQLQRIKIRAEQKQRESESKTSDGLAGSLQRSPSRSPPRAPSSSPPRAQARRPGR